MAERPRHYFDHAATSWPKPDCVWQAIAHWYREIGVSANRGDSHATAQAREVVAQVRSHLAAACGVPSARVAFTSGATEAINLALRGVLPPGARILTTAFEHSSVVRPLCALASELGLRLRVVTGQGQAPPTPAAFAAALAAEPADWLVCTHASNVTGAVLAAAEIAAVARAAGCRTLLDASQTAGWLPIDVGADVLVASAHKALLGPPGLGFLAAQPAVSFTCHKQGGTGSSRALHEHPSQWPEAMEAGTPNTPALFGLHAALEWLGHHPSAERRVAALRSLDRLADSLADLAGIQLFRPSTPVRLPILSLNLPNLEPSELGLILAGSGFEARSGHHCAPWIHDLLGTPAGTLRLSLGEGCPDAVIDELASLLRGLAS